VAVNAVVGWADHDNEAVMLKLAKPTHDVTAGAVPPKFFFGIARRDINGVLSCEVVVTAERDIERPRAWDSAFQAAVFIVSLSTGTNDGSRPLSRLIAKPRELAAALLAGDCASHSHLRA
jgi:hypothetical protein